MYIEIVVFTYYTSIITIKYTSTYVIVGIDMKKW